MYIYISLGTIVPNSRDRQGKLWLLKKQKMALKTTLQQVDILISKNQALQILYFKHIKLHKLATMDRNPQKFNPHKRYCTVLLLYYYYYQFLSRTWVTQKARPANVLPRVQTHTHTSNYYNVHTYIMT